MSEVERETKKIFCNCCRVITHHHLRARYSRVRQGVEDADGNFVAFIDEVEGSEFLASNQVIDTGRRITNSIWSCAGCDQETFEWQYQSEDVNGEWHEAEQEYYPERSQGSIGRAQKHFHALNPKLRNLYAEVIACFNHGSMLLCSVGLRSLLEGICKDKGLTDGNLEHKIEGLIKFLPSVNLIQALHNFRFAGNAAAHDLDPLSREDAEMAIGIVEDLLNFLYDLDYKASQVRVASNKGVPKSGLVH